MPAITTNTRLIALAAFFALTALAAFSLRGGAAAEPGTAGFNEEDFCDKLARLDLVMTSGFEHHGDIGMPATVFTEIKCYFDSAGGASLGPSAQVPVRLEGNAPWVDVDGDFVFGGTLLAEGQGNVAGTPGVKVVLDVDITTEYEISGTYTMGADGELGDPAVYAVTGQFGNATVPTPTVPGSTPKPAPTATPAGDPVAWGDGNCSGLVDPVDSLITLRHDAGLDANTGECPAMGADIAVFTASQLQWGDFDCSGSIDPVDSLKILRFNAGLGVSQDAGCPEPGTEVLVTAS